MNIENKIYNFVLPYYKNKDLMHDITHINRVIKKAEKLAKNYNHNKTILICGAYLHGIINKYYDEITSFLNQNIEDKSLANKIITCAKESDKSSTPETIEGKLIHDAHLLEGGVYFGIIKSFITGSIRNQNLKETINYYKDNILYKFKCSLSENQIELDNLYNKADEIIKNIESEI